MTAVENLFPLFKDKNLLREIEDIGKVKTFREGEIILHENEHIRFVPLILSGSLKVMREDIDGREMLLYYVKPGESCVSSFMGALNNGPGKVKAIVEEDVQILFIPAQASNQWISKYDEWSSFIFRLYNKRFEELLSAIDAVAFHKMDGRLEDYLKAKGKNSSSNEIISTHQQIADELGTAREVVSRLLKQLEKQNKVLLSRNKITLLPSK